MISIKAKKDHDMFDLTTIPRRNQDVLGKTVDDETVLVMPQKGQVKVLNEVGAVVWEMIDGRTTIDQIVEEICTQFHVERLTAERDITKFISDLVDREIVFAAPS